MSKDDLKNLKELKSKNKPRVLTMYFEDGGEISVVPYDDYENLQQENHQLKEQLKQRDEVIDEAIKYIEENTELEHQGGYMEWMNIKLQNIVFINNLLEILQRYKGDNK